MGFLFPEISFSMLLVNIKSKIKLILSGFESGRESISRRIASRGLDLIVVGRDGRGFFPDEWSISRTFRTGEQENLLVADNQTRSFTYADKKTRILLSQYAWGENSGVV